MALSIIITLLVTGPAAKNLRIGLTAHTALRAPLAPDVQTATLGGSVKVGNIAVPSRAGLLAVTICGAGTTCNWECCGGQHSAPWWHFGLGYCI